MNVTSKISVDLTRQNVGQRVNAVQGDGNTRYVEITLLAGGVPWTPPDGMEAAIAYMQPSGTKGMYNLLADGTAAISISGNVATVILAPQMLTVSGTVQASLVFNDLQLNQLTTFPFSVSVVSNPAAGAQKTEDYIRLQWLEDKLDEYLKKYEGGVDEATVQRIVDDYLTANPPTVTETDPTVPAWAKQPQKPTYTADEVHALPDTYIPPNQTAQQVGADPAGTAASAVSQHNTDTAAHNDLRIALKGLSDRINTVLDSDDVTLDQMSEVVAYIKSNKTLIDAITTSKVSIADIVNDLVTNVADKPLSAAQGVVIKGLIDELQSMIPEAYTLPMATETVLGGLKPVTATDAMTQPVGVTAEGRLVTKPGEGGSGISVTGATVGQTVKIAAVDENGVPTAWEAVDFPSGGGEDVWEDVCSITIGDDVYCQHILTAAEGKSYKKLYAVFDGCGTNAIVCCQKDTTFPDTYNGVNDNIASSIKLIAAGVYASSLLEKDSFGYFFSTDKGSGVGLTADANPRVMPVSAVGAHNSPYLNIAYINVITLYSNNASTAIKSGSKLIIKGVRV